MWYFLFKPKLFNISNHVPRSILLSDSIAWVNSTLFVSYVFYFGQTSLTRKHSDYTDRFEALGFESIIKMSS